MRMMTKSRRQTIQTLISKILRETQKLRRKEPAKRLRNQLPSQIMFSTSSLRERQQMILLQVSWMVDMKSRNSDSKIVALTTSSTSSKELLVSTVRFLSRSYARLVSIPKSSTLSMLCVSQQSRKA